MPIKEITAEYRLTNFRSEVEKISIPGQISIDKVNVLDNSLEFGPVQWTEWYARISGHSLEDLMGKGIGLIYGLRLFKTGPVGIIEDTVESKPSPSSLYEKEIPKLWSFFEPSPEAPGEYILLKMEVKHLQKFLQKFFHIKTIGKNLNRGLQKFSTAIQTGDLKQRFIEFAVALETLFLHNKSGEITYKLGNRVASLIGNGKNDYQIFTEVKELYNLRSSIVHGRRVDYTDLFRKLPRMESITRRSILATLALKNQISNHKLASKLDECLHNQSTKKTVRSEIQKFWKGIAFPSVIETEQSCQGTNAARKS